MYSYFSGTKGVCHACARNACLVFPVSPAPLTCAPSPLLSGLVPVPSFSTCDTPFLFCLSGGSLALTIFAVDLPPLPHSYRRSFDASHLTRRRRRIQRFLQVVLAHPALRDCDALKDFFSPECKVSERMSRMRWVCQTKVSWLCEEDACFRRGVPV